MVGDSMVNLLTGMGTARDKTAHTRYAPHVVNNADTYEGSALARRIVDLLGEDATREWRSWQGDNDQIGALEATEDRLGIPAKVEEAIHLARLTGGAALLIGADTGRQAEPLDPERVRRDGLEYVTVLSRFDLNATVIETDVASPYFGLPAYYTLSKDPTVRIHPSRLAIFRGPRRARGFQAVGAARDPWGQPVLEAVYAHLTGCESAIQNTVTLLFDQTVDVFKIPNYAEGYAQDGQTYLSDVEARVALAHGMKSVIKALVLDSEEDYERKGASFSGIADIIDRTQQFLCAATGYPVTVLFGRSPG